MIKLDEKDRKALSNIISDYIRYSNWCFDCPEEKVCTKDMAQNNCYMIQLFNKIKGSN